VAAELHKPDGLVLLRPEDLPGALLTLGLRGLPGIGARMHERLISGGIASIADLYAASADDLRKMWGGVVGARWWHMLRGSADADYPGAFRPTAQLSLSHSHVLAPALRTTEGAHRVLLRLAEKAATRLRKKELVSGAMYVSVRYQDETTRKVARWRSMDMHRTPSSDTTAMLRDMRSLWSDYVAESSGNRIPTQVGICLHRITSVRLVPLSLYDDDSRRQVISTLIDQVNCRFGPHRLEIASVQGLADFAGERIAFAKVSDDDRERHYQR
jgi:DNA polymerase-4